MASVSSPDGNYTATVLILQDPDGEYVVDVQVANVNQSSGDNITVRVNGREVWSGLASEAAGG